MFEYNRTLVWLNEKTIPQEIQQVMDQVEYKKRDTPYIQSNYRVLAKLEKQQQSIEQIFDGAFDESPF